MLFYRVNGLPDMILLGKQTETGVQEIGFDCTAWLSRWPSLAISILVTPPGGAAAYPADTHMEGNTCVWTVNGSDTAKAGNGFMEIVGMANGLKKLSMTCSTRILSTNTDTTGEPPEAAQPWVDKVLAAAAQVEGAKEAADRVEAAVEDLQDGVLDYNSLLNKPCSSVASRELELYNKSVSFTNNKAEITTRLRGPLIAGGIYTLKAQLFASITSYSYRCTAFVRYIGEKAYIVLGNRSLVPGLSDQTVTDEKIAFVIDPDNKLDDNGVCGWIFSDGSFEKPPTVTLTGKYEIITKLPKKFLPDDIEASGGATSWNDLTDKPFGEVSTLTVIPETTPTRMGSNEYMYAEPLENTVSSGDECVVKLNGVEYVCTAQDFVVESIPVVAAGNLGPVTGGDDTGEPFMIMFTPEGSLAAMGFSAVIIIFDGSTEVTLSVICYKETKLPAKYFPEGYAPVMLVGIISDGEVGNWKAVKTFEEVHAAINSGCMVFFTLSTALGFIMLPMIATDIDTVKNMAYIVFGTNTSSTTNAAYIWWADGTFADYYN